MTASKEYNKDNNSDKGIKEKRERGKTAKRFIPPSREEIELFCLENGLRIDIDRFLNYYESNGWMVGRNKMKDWRATVRNWAMSDQKQTPSKPERKTQEKRVMPAQDFEQRDYSDVPDEMLKALEEEMAQARRDGVI